MKTPGGPQFSSLEMMAAENISMKEDIEMKLSQLMDFKHMVEDYSERIEEE